MLGLMYHCIREKLSENVICTSHVKSVDQLEELFNKPFCRSQVRNICNKLGTNDLYELALGWWSYLCQGSNLF